jgi:nucleotide-binding universal stress UspA family protein
METVKAIPRLTVANILFATDFSEASERALPYASSFATFFGARLSVLHAVSPEPHYGVPMDRLPEEFDPVWREAREKIARLEAALQGVRHETLLEQGTAPEVVSHQIGKQQIDLVVLGTRGRRGLKKLLLGSEAEVIFRQTSCPVLTVGPEVKPLGPGGWNLRTILLPTDLSPNSLHALPFALSLAEENQATLIVLHLTPLVPYTAKQAIEADLIAQLRSLLPEDAEDWCRPEFMARFEFPGTGILQVAQEREVDLIVMSLRKSAVLAAAGHSPWHTASEVVGSACCPVLTVRG